MIDVIFVTANNSKKIYQELSTSISAIEPPTWSLILADGCRKKGFKVQILDALAENLNLDESVKRINNSNARLICFVVYGQNVNAGTTSMSGATNLANKIKEQSLNSLIGFIGSHVQALPYETLKTEKSIDIVFANEGFYSLIELLGKKNLKEELKNVSGIFFRKNNDIIFSSSPKSVPSDKLDQELGGYAWDLLPYKKKPFDLYRSPYWHAEYNENFRSPYASLQTSIGCQFGCEFCMINIINRNDNQSVGVASDYSGMRYWGVENTINNIKKLIDQEIYTIRFVDEMFLLNPKYYIPLCEQLSKLNANDNFRFWAYSRIDTIKKYETLKLLRKAGFKWLCLGIESGSKNVRMEVSKGKFEDVNISEIVKKVHQADIEIMANYIFGLPGDNIESMNKTLKMSLDLCTSGWNGYPAMALPGSKLYKDAKEKGYKLPENYQDYSFHSYTTFPLKNENLENYEILKFRDWAFKKYHNDKNFQNRIKSKYGVKALENIKKINKINLKRKILEIN